jgi:hypothetical protein
MEGQYVAVVGSLVTDGAHESDDVVPTEACKIFDLIGLSKACSSNNPDYVREAEENVIKQDWGYGHNDAADDPARWTEVHPPDNIVELPDPGHAETLREVAVLAKDDCLLQYACDTETVDTDIAPPAACSSGIDYQELVGQAAGETNLATIAAGNTAGTGAQITVFGDHIHVHIAVQGKAPYKALGRFKALYRVYCA